MSSTARVPMGNIAALASMVVILLSLTTGAHGTPLDDYVNHDDGCFAVEKLSEPNLEGYGWTGLLYNFTSQCWLDESWSSRPVWTHTLVVIVPHFLNGTNDLALLYITGGKNGGIPSAKDTEVELVGSIAVSTRSVAALLTNVPNQPVSYPWDPFKKGPLTEDGAIAPTWWAFMKNTSLAYGILELPMTKAGVLALDALGIISQLENFPFPQRFVVAGASKRGWATWLVGAVEAAAKNRVVAIIPIVLDAIGVHDFLHRQFRSYGAWSFAMTDYYHNNITAMVDEPNFQALMAIIDPYSYRDRLTMPKLAINAGGDEFQLPDDSRHWAPSMSGEMNLLFVGNADHSMLTGTIQLACGVGAMVQSVIARTSRPSYTWSIDNETGELSVVVSGPEAPTAVTAFVATSAGGVSDGRRDFRWAALNVTPCIIKIFGACVRPVLWKSHTLAPVAPNTYKALYTPEPNSSKWTAFYIQLQWPNYAGPNDFLFTTAVSVVPNTYPFPDCHGEECRGTLC